MYTPNQGQLTAVKMEDLQTTVTKLTWVRYVHDPSFRQHFPSKLSDSPAVRLFKYSPSL